MKSLLDFTHHAKTMMRERLNQEDWVINTVNNPDMTEKKKDDEKHYLKQIPQTGGKFLRDIVNPSVSPLRVITVFFDRRVKK
jgi:hypothetical protein